MHDFNCTEADDMHYELMAERTKYLKENPEGVSIMCKAMEEMRNNASEEKAISIAKNLLQIGSLTYEQIARINEFREPYILGSCHRKSSPFLFLYQKTAIMDRNI